MVYMCVGMHRPLQRHAGCLPPTALGSRGPIPLVSHPTHVHLSGSLTIMEMSSSFFTRAGDSKLATRMPRGFAGWTNGGIHQLGCG